MGTKSLQQTIKVLFISKISFLIEVTSE